jgi:competence protein ComEC
MISTTIHTIRLYFLRALCLILLCLGGCAIQTPASSPEYRSPVEIKEDAQNKLSIHFIDVGQGSAILIKAPEKTVLIDGGERGSPVPAYLRERNIDTLDIVISTHPHSDHIGGLIEVLRQFRVLEVIDPAVPHTTKTYEDYLMMIKEKNIRFTVGKAGLSYDLGGDVLMKSLHPHKPEATHLNDASIVVQVVFGEVRFILTGDAEAPSEREILKRHGNLKSTILQAGHHGSRTSSTPEFIARVQPEVAVIMCGRENRYGHPHIETLETLKRFGVKVYRTDQQGTIVVHSDGYGYEIETKGSSSSLHMGSRKKEPAISPDATEYTLRSINLNLADYDTLQEIIHIGPARAIEIINKRPFRSLSDLRIIRGISPTRLKEIKEEGKAYVQ